MKNLYVLVILITLNFKSFSNEVIHFNIDELQNYNTIMLVITPKTGVIKLASKGAMDYYGYKNLIGMKISQINLLSNDEIELEMNKAYREERNFFEFKHKLAGGEVRKVQVNSYPMKYNNEDILLSRVIDVTESSREKFIMEFIKKSFVFILFLTSFIFYLLIKKLKKLVEDKTILIENIPEILYSYSTKYGSVYYSSQFQKILGYSKKEFQDNPKLWQNSIFKEDMDTVKEAINNAIHGKNFNIEYRIKNKFGEYIWLNDRSIMIKNKSNETIITGLAENITNIKNREIELIHSKEIAEKANKAKSDFLANMSHEIRTPMNGINGFVELLLDMESHNEKKDYLKIIKDSSNHLLSIINDILCLSKIEAGKFEINEKDINIVNKIYLISNIFIKQSESKGIEFKVEIDKGLDKIILIDEQSILKIVNNLLSNALKFTEKGYIKLSMKNLENKKIELIIQDTGTGINEEKQKRLFEPFEQGEHYSTKQYGGTGLGLSIVKNIIDLLKGEIFVKTKIGIGTEFKLIIPYKESTNKKYLENDEIKSLDIKSTLRIISAEDMEINQKLLEKNLEKRNIHFKKVYNGKELLEELEKDYYSLILMDMQMPILNGIEATKIIRKHKFYHGIPIIATSACAFEENINEMYEAGINDHIIKPIQKNILIEKINKWSDFSKY